MQKDYTVFNLPVRAFAEANNSDTPEESNSKNPVYEELNKIAEELEECRLRNC